ncbi:MAG: hypothetical protein M0Z69_01255 [Actinomycetota bacterium]|nr:hypothetical protein [Actinomycetota bacterium]
MATRAEHARQLAGTTTRSRTPARQEELERQLGLLDHQQLQARAKRRQFRVLVVLSGIFLAAALVVVAGGRALLAGDQVRADSLQAGVASALSTEQNLLLQRAELEAPARVLAIAERRLKMVTPSSVVYLAPVNPGESVAQAHRGLGAVSSRPSGRGRRTASSSSARVRRSHR